MRLVLVGAYLQEHSNNGVINNGKERGLDGEGMF